MPSHDPWSRPTLHDLRTILEHLDQPDRSNQRAFERIELTVPAELTTARGNVISAITREISRHGIGLMHRGSVNPGQCTVRVASDSREYAYQVAIEWCVPCENGMFFSGGRFLQKDAE